MAIYALYICRRMSTYRHAGSWSLLASGDTILPPAKASFLRYSLGGCGGSQPATSGFFLEALDAGENLTTLQRLQ